MFYEFHDNSEHSLRVKSLETFHDNDKTQIAHMQNIFSISDSYLHYEYILICLKLEITKTCLK